MDVKINCPNCDQHILVDSTAVGQEVVCPTCSKPFTLDVCALTAVPPDSPPPLANQITPTRTRDLPSSPRKRLSIPLITAAVLLTTVIVVGTLYLSRSRTHSTDQNAALQKQTIAGAAVRPGAIQTAGNFEFIINWKPSITSPVWLSDAPPLVYKTTKEATATQVLIVTRWKEMENGAVQLNQTPFFRAISIISKSGEIDMSTWRLIMDGTLRVLQNVGGTGTLQVALFEAKKQAASEQKNACECQPGRQVSDWLELPVKVGMQ